MTDGNIVAGIGAVLGYVGAEAATTAVFDRLLWPQRYYSVVDLRSIPRLLLLSPMGGPIHKAMLNCLDRALTNGLFKGKRQGHMLGTSFFPDEPVKYTMHHGGEQNPSMASTEPARNCIWMSALANFPLRKAHTDAQNTAAPVSKIKSAAVDCRAQVAFCQLELHLATPEDKASNAPFILEQNGIPSVSSFVALVLTETTAFLPVLAVRSSWVLLLFIPVLLKLCSAALCMYRQPLIGSGRGDEVNGIRELPRNFEVHSAASQGPFILITGLPSVVLQFFRHYGHPIRNRPREILQTIIIVLYGCNFPLGLLCFVMWMPPTMQYTWLAYQIYVVLTLYVDRYCHSYIPTSVEAQIVQGFLQAESIQNRKTILFGQCRNDSSTIRASLRITVCNRHHEGIELMRKLIGHNEKDIIN